ncbi:MAG: hypothetical protein Q9223_000126 [Gallowayella weberi]
MRTMILASIIGAAAFAVHGVLGAALPVKAIGRSTQYGEAQLDTIGARHESGPNTVVERHEPENGDLLGHITGSADEGETDKRVALAGPIPEAAAKDSDNVYKSTHFLISPEEAMSFKPLVKATQGQCFTLRKDFLDNCQPLRKKATFTWDIFFYCYIQGDCPKKRGRFPALDVEASSESTSGKSKLRARQTPIFPADVPRQPSDEVANAAIRGQAVIPDKDFKGNKCWIFHDDKKGDCLKRLAAKKDLDMRAWGDCYTLKDCPKKRDAIPDPKEISLENRDALLRLTANEMALSDDIKHAVENGQRVINQGQGNKCWVLRGNRKCAQLRGHFEPQLFVQCYSSENCPSKRDIVSSDLETRETLDRKT